MKLHVRLMLRRLLSYHEGDLPYTDRHALERHLACCAECRLFLHRMERTDQLVGGALPGNEPLHPEGVRAGLVRALSVSGARNRPFAGTLFGAFGVASLAAVVCVCGLAMSHGRGKLSQTAAVEPPRLPDGIWFHPDPGTREKLVTREKPVALLAERWKRAPRHRRHARRHWLMARSIRPRHPHPRVPEEVPDVPSAPAAFPGSVVLVAATVPPTATTADFYDKQTADGIQASVRYVDSDTPGYAEAASVRSNLGVPTWTKATVSSEQPGSEVVERPLMVAGLPR